MEPTFYWWKPRKKHTRPPHNWVASVYGIVATEEYLEPDEIDRCKLTLFFEGLRDGMVDKLMKTERKTSINS